MLRKHKVSLHLMSSVVCVCVRVCVRVCVCVRACVEHLKRCKTSTLIDGIAFSFQVLCHYNDPVLNILPGVYPISFSIAEGVTVDFLVTPTKLWKSTGWKFGRKLLYLQCRSWVHSSRSWGTRQMPTKLQPEVSHF